MKQSTASWYERLGRRAGITPIAADLLRNRRTHPLLNPRCDGSDDRGRGQ